MKKATYVLSFREISRLHKRSYRAQQEDHLEVCGVMVVGKDKRIELVFVENKSSEAYNYRFDKKDLFPILVNAREESKRILGSFHTHPIGEPYPTEGDLMNGFYNSHELIYDVCGREARLWRLKRPHKSKIFVEIPLDFELTRKQNN